MYELNIKVRLLDQPSSFWYVIAARAAPISGATMNTQSDAMGSLFPFIAAITAGAMDLAGLTLVPVRPMPKM